MKTVEPIRDLYNEYHAALLILAELSMDLSQPGEVAFRNQLQVCRDLKRELFFAEQQQVTNKW